MYMGEKCILYCSGAINPSPSSRIRAHASSLVGESPRADIVARECIGYLYVLCTLVSFSLTQACLSSRVKKSC